MVLSTHMADCQVSAQRTGQLSCCWLVRPLCQMPHTCQLSLPDSSVFPTAVRASTVRPAWRRHEQAQRLQLEQVFAASDRRDERLGAHCVTNTCLNSLLCSSRKAGIFHLISPGEILLLQFPSKSFEGMNGSFYRV